jgi:dienelactone hydrolase
MAGIVLMFPSLRGGNDNPGKKEYFLGEIDDVLAATDYLAAQPYVDKNRIYLGGHSTGGTLALLVAESSNRYRAVFSFGPTDDVSNYPPEYRAFDAANIREALIRSPGRWLHSLQSPLFVFEGTDQANNIPALQTMAAAANKNPLAHFYAVKGASHFSILTRRSPSAVSRIPVEPPRQPTAAILPGRHQSNTAPPPEQPPQAPRAVSRHALDKCSISPH